MLGFDPHPLLNESLAGADVRTAVDLEHAVETDAHTAEQPARLVVPACMAPNSTSGRQQRRGDRFAFESRQFLPVEREADGAVAPRATDAVPVFVETIHFYFTTLAGNQFEHG